MTNRAAALVGFLALAAARADDSVDFARDIRPILTVRCVACHGPDKQRGGLRLDAKSSAFKGGDTGPALVAGKSADSLLVRLVSGQDADRAMPPEGEQLTADQIAKVRAWIDAGAAWPSDAVESPSRLDWWSLKPLARPAVPLSTRNPIDAFVHAKLREKGLTPSSETDRRTFIRRITFDLVGLPPTPEEIDAFVRDTSADAHERLADRLLASPRHGERWARHWLDVVHYGDSHGYDKDQPRPNAYPYRDYVIRAFNDDKPYGRFVREQIAGDVLYPGVADAALGFLAAGPWDLIGHTEVPESKNDGKVARHLDRDDMVANTINTFASLTVQCAQCHNHKFDPIAQDDYYRLQAVFAAVDRADKPLFADAESARRAADLLNERAAARKTLRELEKAKTKDAPAIADATARLAAVEREFANYKPTAKVFAATVHQGTGNFTGTGADLGRPRPIFVLRRGDVKSPMREVGPGTLAVVPELPATFDLPPGHREGERRVALANWLTDPRNPLTYRSIVNRVWQYHFGRALAATPNDFGRMGQAPTHPELLDWLAVEFRDGGQSLKKLHRLIVTSATYRQSSANDDRAAAIDGDNAFLWRMNRRKLEAEAVRDSMLSVAGKLDLTMYGPAFRDFVVEHPAHSPHYEYHLHDPEDPKSHRRSIYRFLARSKPQPFMTALDCADPSTQVDRRNQTLSPLQALALFNDGFVLAMAKHLAAKAGNVETAFEWSVGRPPNAAERTALADFARDHGLANACRVILNANAFLFVD